MKSGYYRSNRFYRSWSPVSFERVIIISHGLGEHSGRYTHVGEFFKSHGYAVFALDHIGHGKTEGIRGHVSKFEDYTDNLRHFIDFVEAETSIHKIILIGHSLGAVISHFYMLLGDARIEKLILSSPAYEKLIPPSAIKSLLGKLFSRLFPRVTLWNELNAEDVSRDSEIVSSYISDGLNHDRVSTRFFTSFLLATAKIEAEPTVCVPCLYVVAGNDKIVSARKSKEIFIQMFSDDKKFIEYPELYHEIFNEKEKNIVFNDLLSWLEGS